jgi:Uma2 family endonuclease
MADNTLQFQWIVTLQGNLDLLFRDDPAVFVAGDHLIYPVEGEPQTRQAPDVYVAFGRPKGHRGSYKVWEEDGIFPQVVFEVWSPNNRYSQMEDKRNFYERYGAEEYYILYPDFPAHIDGWRRENGHFVRIPELNGWVSPRLGIRFELQRGEVAVYRPDGGKFLTFVERGTLAEEESRRAAAERQRAEEESRRAAAERQRAEEESRRAAAERQRAEEESRRAAAERQRAEEESRRAAAERQRAEEEFRRAAKLAARLRELGIDPDSV